MVYFNGTLKVKVMEAKDLKATACATRHAVGPAAKLYETLDPYVAVDVDNVTVGKTSTKGKTNAPQWNEEITADVHNGQHLCFTIYHDAALPPDDFVADCTISFESLKANSDLWVSLGDQQVCAVTSSLNDCSLRMRIQYIV